MDREAYAKHNKPESGAQPGVYKHPESKEELWAETHPAADAFVRQGWVFSRELPSAEERAKAAVGLKEIVEEAKEETKEKEGKK